MTKRPIDLPHIMSHLMSHLTCHSQNTDTIHILPQYFSKLDKEHKYKWN